MTKIVRSIFILNFFAGKKTPSCQKVYLFLVFLSGVLSVDSLKEKVIGDDSIEYHLYPIVEEKEESTKQMILI